MQNVKKQQEIPDYTVFIKNLNNFWTPEASIALGFDALVFILLRSIRVSNFFYS